MRDDYRDRMHGVEEVLRELRQIGRHLQDGDESRETPTRDIERALSNVSEALTVLTLFRPVRTSDLARHMEEIRDELREIRNRLDDTEESQSSDPEPTPSPDPDPEPPPSPDPDPEPPTSEDDGTEESGTMP